MTEVIKNNLYAKPSLAVKPPLMFPNHERHSVTQYVKL